MLWLAVVGGLMFVVMILVTSVAYRFLGDVFLSYVAGDIPVILAGGLLLRGLWSPPGWHQLAVWGGVTFLISALFNWYLSRMDIETEVEKVLKGMSMWQVGITLLLFAPLVEEVVFRGFIQWGLEPYLGFGAVVFSALLFALVHAVPFGPMPAGGLALMLAMVFALGLVLSYIFYTSHSLPLCAFSHASANIAGLAWFWLKRRGGVSP